MSIIEVENLSKNYGSLQAVNNISFNVEQGQIYGFLGPNGSGKTTTIGMMLDIINRSSGTIRIFDETDLTRARQRIGATLETPNFYPYLSGWDNLQIVADIKGAKKPAIEKALDIVKLTLRKKDKFKTYSLGMKQRLALASAILSNPDLVILDEPANGLDPEGIREIRDIIKALAAEGKTIFLSSHLLNEVEQTCTHLAVIKKGKLITQGSMLNILSRNVVVMMRSENLETLNQTLVSYPEYLSAKIEKDSVIAELKTEDIAGLNKFLSDKGIYVSHLARYKQSLEDVFLELTSGLNQTKEAA